MRTRNRDDTDNLIAELTAGTDRCEGRYDTDAVTRHECEKPATHIVYIDGGRGDHIGRFCPTCREQSDATKAVFAAWDGVQWIKAEDLPRWAHPGSAEPPTPPPPPYPYRRRPGSS